MAEQLMPLSAVLYVQLSLLTVLNILGNLFWSPGSPCARLYYLLLFVEKLYW